MNILIYGAGAIGVTYAWLLSGKHDVTVLVKPEREESARAGFSLAVKDLREKPAKENKTLYRPRIVTDIEDRYDVILVAVNRYQLAGVLPHLERVDADIILMLNHWEIKQELDEHLRPEQYLIGFPSQVGGGREGTAIRVNVYDEGTVLGEADGVSSERLNRYRQEFEQAGLKVEVKDNILDWMKVHYLQQSISAGAVLKAGSYEAFAGDYRAVLEMVHAFRDGIKVCEACGVRTKKLFPANLFRYPAPLVAFLMKRMFHDPDTVAMVTGHMKQGMDEWVWGYLEVMRAGQERGVAIPHWESYEPFISDYVQKQAGEIDSGEV